MTRRRWALAAVAAFAAAAAIVLGVVYATGDDHRYSAEIRRTAYGIPHVLAKDYGSLGYGYGYAFAQDNLRVLADRRERASRRRPRRAARTASGPPRPAADPAGPRSGAARRAAVAAAPAEGQGRARELRRGPSRDRGVPGESRRSSSFRRRSVRRSRRSRRRRPRRRGRAGPAAPRTTCADSRSGWPSFPDLRPSVAPELPPAPVGVTRRPDECCMHGFLLSSRCRVHAFDRRRRRPIPHRPAGPTCGQFVGGERRVATRAWYPE
jgi:Penicillin amidase